VGEKTSWSEIRTLWTELSEFTSCLCLTLSWLYSNEAGNLVVPASTKQTIFILLAFTSFCQGRKRCKLTGIQILLLHVFLSLWCCYMQYLYVSTMRKEIESFWKLGKLLIKFYTMFYSIWLDNKLLVNSL
jgi:hypothetical protein